MTEEKDGPVHYQVSVTGRQAATFFLCLLAALGLSFFFGMKTGAAAKKGPDPIAALTAQSDISVPAVEVESRGDRATQEPTEAPIGFEAATPVPPATKPPKTSVPEERAAPVEEPKIVELAPEPTAVPARKALATPVPEKEPAASKQGDEALWVQIVVTSDAEKADALAKKLRTDGFKPVVSPVTGKKGLSFRVRIGPYSSRSAAEAAAAKVQKAEKLQTKPIIVAGK
ncbi:MAG TPA: SPOR domain-containing protein [Thermoanaerobaculia bacterium]|nr:SPOR domain-containing protein [Thermoanaerobaculia bacterium]